MLVVDAFPEQKSAHQHIRVENKPAFRIHEGFRQAIPQNKTSQYFQSIPNFVPLI